MMNMNLFKICSHRFFFICYFQVLSNEESSTRTFHRTTSAQVNLTTDYCEEKEMRAGERERKEKVKAEKNEKRRRRWRKWSQIMEKDQGVQMPAKVDMVILRWLWTRRTRCSPSLRATRRPRWTHSLMETKAFRWVSTVVTICFWELMFVFPDFDKKILQMKVDEKDWDLDSIDPWSRISRKLTRHHSTSDDAMIKMFVLINVFVIDKWSWSWIIWRAQ